MNPQIENKQETLNDSMNICEVDVQQWLSILESRTEKSIESREEFYKYTQFCENIFTVPDNMKDNQDYITKIENNNKQCVNIFDQCLTNA